MKNFGLDLQREVLEIDQEQDEVFGAGSPECIALIPEEDREKYLPQGEVQKTDHDDLMDCASRAPVNIAEAKLNFLYQNNFLSPDLLKWLFDTGYVNEQGNIEVSDAYIAILSGTTRQGNSLKSPLQAIHEYGLVPKKLLPLNLSMTFEEYHDPKRITDKIKDIGRQFKERLPVRYARVLEKDYELLQKEDFLDVAGYAWPEPDSNGVYPNTPLPPNHAFVTFKTPCYHAFDNYRDSFDGDFVKKLSPDYDLLDYGYRLYFTGEQKPLTEEDKKNILTVFWELLKKGLLSFFPTFFEEYTKPSPVTPETAPVTMSERLAQEAEGWLGKDASPRNFAPQELSCAEGGSNIIHAVYPTFPKNILSTAGMVKLLDGCATIERVKNPGRGVIIVSPRTPELPGHMGFFIDETRIISNDSGTGFMSQNYDYDGWKKKFHDGRGLKVILYKFIG